MADNITWSLFPVVADTFIISPASAIKGLVKRSTGPVAASAGTCGKLLGNLIPGKKKIDYFLTFEPTVYKDRKIEFLSKLSESSKILLIFELDLEKEPEAHRFIFND